MTGQEKILLLLRNIENSQNRENRYDRVKALEKDNELMRGYIERIEERNKALEKYLGVEFIKESKFKKI